MTKIFLFAFWKFVENWHYLFIYFDEVEIYQQKHFIWMALLNSKKNFGLNLLFLLHGERFVKSSYYPTVYYMYVCSY